MTKKITLFWLLFCVIGMGAFAIGQDENAIDVSNSNSEQTWTTLTRGAAFLAASKNCDSCHRSTGGTLDLNLLSTHIASADSWQLYRRIAATGDGLSCGNYLITELNDSLLRTHLRLKDRHALVVVNAPMKEGSATQLEAGDVLLAVDGDGVESVLSFRNKMDQAAKAKVQIKLLREGREINQMITAADVGTPPKVYRIGVQVESPNDAMRSQLNLFEKEGLLVLEVLDEPAAKATGLQVHDILLRANDTRLTSVEDLKTSVSKSQGNTIEINLLRKGREVILKVIPYVVPEPQLFYFNLTGKHGGQLKCPAQSFHGLPK